MKKGWETKKVSDVCAVSLPARAPEGRVPYVEIGDVNVDTKHITSKNKGAVKGSVLAPAGSLLVSRVRPTRGAIAMLEQESAVSSAFTILKPRDILDLRLLFYRLAYSDAFSGSLGKKQTGLLYPSVKEDVILDYEISYPTCLQQQKSIVDILDEAFESIAMARANAQRNLQNARALYTGHLQNAFSFRNEGCVERRLSEMAKEVGRGKSRHRPRNEPALYGGPYPFIQTGDISRADHWLSDFTQTYSELGLAQSRMWPAGTVCIAIVGATVGETAILGFDACFPDSVIGIVVDSNVDDAEYVEYMLQSFKALLKEKGQGAARDNINLGTFENQLFPFPTLRRQQEIVSTLNDLRNEVRRLEATAERKLATLDELRQSLLAQAFAGSLTGKSSEKQVAKIA